MKWLIGLFVVFVTGGVAYAASKKKALQGGSTPGDKSLSTVAPGYNPKASLWSADQPSSSPKAPANPIVVIETPACTYQNAEGCAGGTFGPQQQANIPSGQAKPSQFCIPGFCVPLPTVTIDQPVSPTFWAADKVPVNFNMPGSDADPNLAVDWTVVGP